MGIFSRTKEKKGPMLLFHIGSSFVGGALFWPEPSGTPKIIFSALEPIALGVKLETNQLFSQTLRALDIVAGRIHRSAQGAPQRIFCVLSSPWYASQTRTLQLKKNNPFLFTEKVANDLIKKEIKLFSEEHLSPYANTPDALRTIELKNVKTLLNGYETSEPLYQPAREIEMTIFISMSGETVLAKIEQTVARHFHSESIKFSSFAVASFTIIRDLLAQRDSFLLLDIGGELTDIFMVKKNVLRDSISFPLGRNFLLRGVAEGLGTSFSEAASLLSLFKDGHAEETVRKKLESVMARLRAEWLAKFQESLARLSDDISIPATVYVTTEGDLADLFAEIIRAEQFSQYTLAESKFNITILSPDSLHSLVAFAGEFVRDPFLTIDCVYLNRFLIKM